MPTKVSWLGRGGGEAAERLRLALRPSSLVPPAPFPGANTTSFQRSERLCAVWGWPAAELG